MNRWFITGTDTEIGKTHVSCALVRHLASLGYTVAGLKPVASGCHRTPDGLRNEDALALMQAANTHWPYEVVNPVALEPAIAPHLAAQQAGIEIDPDAIARAVAGVSADFIVVEGVGGWCVPLVGGHMLADLARRLADEVILVVGMRLGCISHALLTARAIEQDGMRLRGWIANRIDPDMPVYGGNLETLESKLRAPLIATMDWAPQGGELDIRCMIPARPGGTQY